MATGPAEPGAAPPPAADDLLPSPTRGGFGLFGRTFFLLAALLLVSILAWLQTLRVFELEPRAVQTAQQIASIVNLSRAALIHSDSIARVSLIKTMTEQEAVRILPREPDDRLRAVSARRARPAHDAGTGRRGWAPTPWWPTASTTNPACGSASRSTRTATGC